MSEAVILMVDDLMFLPQLEGTLRTLGYLPIVATNDLDLSRALGQAPVLVIVDLFTRSFDWEALVRFLKGPDKKGDHVPVLGFGPHVDLALRERALAAGCEAVVGRGAVATQLRHLVEKHKWVVNEERCKDPPPALLLTALELFNRGEYFECHEVIETAWVEEKGTIRLMYQGILQIGVACYHVQKQNWRGAMKVLERGLPKVRRFAPCCMGINLAKLLIDAEKLRHELVRLGPDWQGVFDEQFYPFIEISLDGLNKFENSNDSNRSNSNI